MVTTRGACGSDAASWGAWRGSAMRTVGTGVAVASNSPVRRPTASTRSRTAVAAAAWRSGRRRSGRRGMATSRAACAGSKASGGRPNQASEPARTPSRLPPNGARVSQIFRIALPTKASFELDGAGNLDQLGAKGARTRLEQPGGLHRQRRAAGDDMAAAHKLRGGAYEGDGVDTGMVPEAAVLDCDQQVGQQRRCGVRAEPPDAAGCGEQGERAVVAVEDFGAERGEAGEVGRERVIERCSRSPQAESRERGGDKEKRKNSPSPCGRGLGGGGRGMLCRPLPPTPSRKGRGSMFSLSSHSAPTTVIRPAACRANTAGRYMSATSAPGSS